MSHNHHANKAHYPDCTDPATCRCETRRYTRVLAIASFILALEIAGGMASGSLALLADAGHVFTDMSAILVSIFVAEYARRRDDSERVRNIGFLINIALLIIVAITIAHEAVERFSEHRAVTSWIMLAVAALGGLGNWVQHKVLEGAHDHKTGRVLNLHVMSDLLTSVVVVIGGIAIWATGIYWIDTALSLLIATWILIQVGMLMKNPDGHHHH